MRNIESGSERKRGLYILKARGLPHSNQIREFFLTDHGLDLQEGETQNAAMAGGSSRGEGPQASPEAGNLRQGIEERIASLDHRQRVLESQLADLRAEGERVKAEHKPLRSASGARKSSGGAGGRK